MNLTSPGTGPLIGYGIIFLVTIAEFIGLPAPGGPLLVLAAAQMATSSTGMLFLTLTGGIASAIGDAPWYFLGRYGGPRVLRFYCKFTLGSAACVSSTERFFRCFGVVTVVFSKCFSGVRLFAPPLAGHAGYSFPSFLALDLVGGVFWAGALVLFGRILAPHIHWALNSEWIWILSFLPVGLFVLGRLFTRMIKGPGEEVIPLVLRIRSSRKLATITEESEP
jgi:membrane protein DedA with SNARE-associated domain